MALPPLVYLSASDVATAMPDLPDRLHLAEATMVGLVEGGELPPKVGVHPRPDGAFAHAMPAFLRGSDETGAADRLGMKWVLGFPGNASMDLPAIHGLVLLNDPQTGVPIAILDAGPITAQRTAAVSGVALRAFAPAVSGRAPRAALIGAGVQGRSHLEVLGHVLPGVELRVHDANRARAEALAAACEDVPGIASATAADDARSAVADADVVVTAASFTTPDRRQVMTNDWLAPEVTVVPVDYATYLAAEVARDAALFLVDHRDQFLANRDAGQFDSYPDPTAMLGEALMSATARPRGRVVVTHLGVGLADVVFGHAILERAVHLGLGMPLAR
jgi:ornithine cyclodeaminase/alanine dehydrogenase-like protein (mu-crystallin family)